MNITIQYKITTKQARLHRYICFTAKDLLTGVGCQMPHTPNNPLQCPLELQKSALTTASTELKEDSSLDVFILRAKTTY